MTSNTIIGIMGSGEAATEEEISLAYSLSQKLSENGFIVLCGGRPCGVMSAVAKGAKAANGISIGILPGDLKDSADPNITIPIITGMGNARNNINILTSDVIIAIGSTPGTLSEIALAIKSKKRLILTNQSDLIIEYALRYHYNKVKVSNDIDSTIELLLQWFK